jgi:DNA-binding GntR family transcriptional regulator
MSVSSGPTTTTQHALDGVRRMIAGGELQPGGRLGQDDIAQRLGVSIAPVREALQILAQEGQVTYLPRRGYFVTELRLADLQEIYGLRAVLEARAATSAVAAIDGPALGTITTAAADCVAAVDGGSVLAELEANRRFHFAILEPAQQPHTLRVIRMLWESTEAYRALYYDFPEERSESLRAHERIVVAIRARDAEHLVAELDDHRNRALTVLGAILP